MEQTLVDVLSYSFTISQGKDFEQTHEFQKYLQRLKRIRTGEIIETADLIEGKMGAFGLVVFSNSLLDVQQSDLAQLPLYEGAFLTIGEAGEQCEVRLKSR